MRTGFVLPSRARAGWIPLRLDLDAIASDRGGTAVDAEPRQTRSRRGVSGATGAPAQRNWLKSVSHPLRIH